MTNTPPNTLELRNAYIKFRKVHKKYMASFIELYQMADDCKLINRESLTSFLAMLGAMKTDNDPKFKTFLDKAADHVKVTQEAMEAWENIQETPQALATNTVMDRLETGMQFTRMPIHIADKLLSDGHYIDDIIEVVLEDEQIKYRKLNVDKEEVDDGITD